MDLYIENNPTDVIEKFHEVSHGSSHMHAACKIHWLCASLMHRLCMTGEGCPI